MRIPERPLPGGIAKLLARLPAAPPSWLLVAGLNQLLSRGILPADMDLLAGKRFRVCLQDAGLQLDFSADQRRFTLGCGEPDLKLAANCGDFARMLLRAEDPDTLFFQRKLSIEGDTELGLIVKNLLDSVDWSQTPLARLMAG
ncbi:ubiquinone anaerobic biosynthesis accessory factor UbiT [Chromobacterium sphagni]|uniref:Ubiquinone biosynthesis accessory factor UbiT n=1 Tax=Chromobacterium sphagni TaxID=1903179 RepID=A0A1S1X3E3_9NEIS|nr:SCP2 sterol-binding domain-containing protein [Chromobacterium sphagni]OHX13766.1 Sterol-binding domain protein [Chromobacterium sphagni]OHX18142.1 Sterol-binding domain protein [Chromobacterium sphagni]